MSEQTNGNGKTMKQIIAYSTLIFITVGTTVAIIKFFSADDVRAAQLVTMADIVQLKKTDEQIIDKFGIISDMKTNIALICQALKITCK